MMNSIGAKVHKLRKEKGNPPRPSGKKLMSLSHALGVTPDFLLGIEDDAQTAEDKLFISRYLKSDVDIKHKIRNILDIISSKG
jgi:transcriptional regulator with XRE-family HTH domain